jgi:hypothetical protein
VREQFFGAFSFGSGDQRLNYDTTRAGIQATATLFSHASPTWPKPCKSGILDSENAAVVEQVSNLHARQ